MKHDTLAIVNAHNETLWVRASTFPLDKAYEAYRVIQQGHDLVTLICSHTDSQGEETHTEIMTPLAMAVHAARKSGEAVKGVSIELWYRTPPVFMITEEDAQALKDVADQFVLAGRIRVPASESAEEMLERAYMESQNIETNWNPASPARSSSTGDVFRFSIDGQPARNFAVMNVGFKEIAFEPVVTETQKKAGRKPG